MSASVEKAVQSRTDHLRQRVRQFSRQVQPSGRPLEALTSKRIRQKILKKFFAAENKNSTKGVGGMNPDYESFFLTNKLIFKILRESSTVNS